MRQLAQWTPQADKFRATDTEVICVFREEKDGDKGLAKSKKASKAPFVLANDLGAKSTKPYKAYFAYLIDKEGILRAVKSGTKPKRPAVTEILKEIEKLP